MRCPTCKKPNTLRPWVGSETRMGVELIARGDRCEFCGETLFDHEEMGRQERLMATGVVARGIRKANEFRFVRTLTGFKANEVAAMLDVRPETVSRWERGEVEIPRLAAFALGELYEHPRVVRAKLEAFAR